MTSGAGVKGFSFRFAGKVVQSDSLTCLYRQTDAEASITCFLILTKDRRFAYLERPVGGNGLQAAEEWSADRARTFLMQHGEGDIVDQFPDIFQRRPVAAQPAKPRKPKDNDAEPSLFPIH
jgi:hypothetical protein